MGRPKRKEVQEPASGPWAPAKNVTNHHDRNLRNRLGSGPSCAVRGIKQPGKQSWLLIDVHGTSQVSISFSPKNIIIKLRPQNQVEFGV